jgi:hypothetical protein
MTTIEQPTPREVRAAIREQFAKMPPTVDANGWLPGETHMGNPSEAPGDVLQDPVTEPNPNLRAPGPTGPRPDPSQGYQGTPAPRPLSVLERIHAQAAKHNN